MTTSPTPQFEIPNEMRALAERNERSERDALREGQPRNGARLTLRHYQ